MQLCTGHDFHWVEPGFSGHAGQAKRAELVGDFAAAMTAVVVAVNAKDILCDGGQEPLVVTS